MPLQLRRGSGLRLRPQDIIRRLHKPCDEVLGAQIRCLPHWRSCRQGLGEDAVKRLTDDVDQLDAQNPCSAESDVKNEKTETILQQLSDDVQKQLHRVLEVIKELTAEKGERAACQRHTPLSEAVELLEQFIAADLPVHLLAELPVLQFEARKDVMNVCCALMWPGMPQPVGSEVLRYFQHHPRLFPILVEGYENEEAALHYGVVLRSCARHAELVEAFLESRLVFDLMRYTQHPSVDISSDAFYSLREVLLEHKEVSAAWLEENYQEFFGAYNDLLRSGDYMVERQALTQLALILLDRNFKRVMLSYVGNERHLQIFMNLLLDPSRAIQMEAFHVFKIFVANPEKTPRVQQILFNNKDKLVRLLESFEALRPDDRRFREDQRTVVDKLTSMARMPSSSGSNAKA